MSTAVIVIHGGAWAIPDKLAQRSVDGVKHAAKTGYDVLSRGGSALDAVQAAVVEMENDPAFDAGTDNMSLSLSIYCTLKSIFSSEY